MTAGQFSIVEYPSAPLFFSRVYFHEKLTFFQGNNYNIILQL